MSHRKSRTRFSTTKLYRPPVPNDYVPRPRLEKRLNYIAQQPLTLISAPAGYGKTTAVVAWLEGCGHQSAWLSIDESDNDLSVFLSYFLGALRRTLPTFGAELDRMVRGTSSPSAKSFVNSLNAELDNLEEDIILALDDFHEIHNDSVLDLFRQLMTHPHPALHLVLVTRRDPRLPLNTWRARTQLVEIRARDLRFNLEETRNFLTRASAAPLSDKIISSLYFNTEGWAVGLRLAVLSVANRENVEDLANADGSKSHQILDYLSEQVISDLPVAKQRFLIQSSILDRFSASLCEAIISTSESSLDGQAMLKELNDANLFITPLSDDQEWFRYHHLFRDLLRGRLRKEYSTEEVASLQLRACQWFLAAGFVDEAIHYALAASEVGTAIELVGANRHDLLNQERLLPLDRWIRMFTEPVINSSPDLLLTKAWFAWIIRNDIVELTRLTGQIEKLIGQLDLEPAQARLLTAENAVLRGIVHFFLLDAEASLANCRRALEGLPESYYLARSYAWLFHALSQQILGDLPAAFETSRNGQREDLAYSERPRGRGMGIAGFIYWILADLSGVKKVGELLVASATTEDQRNTLSWGHYFLACVYYHQNDLANAMVHAQKAHEERHENFGLFNTHSQLIMARIYQAMGHQVGVREVMKVAHTYAMESRSEPLVFLVDAFQIELDVLQGKLANVDQWALRTIQFLPPAPLPMVYQPHLTVPKALLAVNDPANAEQLSTYLLNLHEYVAASHNIHYLIEVLALEAMAHDRRGDEEAAFEVLEQSLSLANPSGFIRLFVDLGPQMKELLDRLSRKKISAFEHYISQILGTFPLTNSNPVEEMIEPLTDRENQILVLLSERYSNKEIAQRLFISPGTVKRHTLNIYQKFGVQSRRQAVEAAQGLGIVE
jgi:LuxR family transcriptional regulator, maltose regulon positive regulatory protein